MKKFKKDLFFSGKYEKYDIFHFWKKEKYGFSSSASALTVVWLLYSEYMILWTNNDEGVSTLNSTQSMIQRTFGYFSFIEMGIDFFTCSLEGHMFIDPRRMYIKFIQVLIVLLTVPSLTLNKNAIWQTSKFLLNLINVKMKASKGVRILGLPTVTLSFLLFGSYRASHFPRVHQGQGI